MAFARPPGGEQSGPPAPLAAAAARDGLLERHFAEVETEPSAGTVGMLAAATRLTAMQVANWFDARRRQSELNGGQRGCERAACTPRPRPRPRPVMPSPASPPRARRRPAQPDAARGRLRAGERGGRHDPLGPAARRRGLLGNRAGGGRAGRRGAVGRHPGVHGGRGRVPAPRDWWAAGPQLAALQLLLRGC